MLRRLVFRWIFIPWIQSELDRWVERINNTRKRPDRNKILPHGPPNDIYSSPERYGALDFKVQVQISLVLASSKTFDRSRSSLKPLRMCAHYMLQRMIPSLS